MTPDESRGRLIHDEAAIIRAVLDGYALPPHGIHGLAHWARVLENGLRLAQSTKADAEIVRLFAIFHDSRRWNDDHDPGHGERGAELARSLRGTWVHLDDERFALLHRACKEHTETTFTHDATILTCWDSDKLELPRVGIAVDPSRLGTAAAVDLMEWSEQRAEQEYHPTEILKEWGVKW